MVIRIERKKKGFTLIELIAVLAIIAILMVVFVPKVSAYIGKAKKVKALEQVRQVVLAVDTYNINATTPIGGTATYESFKDKISSTSENDALVNIDTIKSIPEKMSYARMKELLHGEREYYLDDNGCIKDNIE